MTEEQTYAQVVLTGVEIPFGKLVTLMIKLTVASIPALIIFSILGFVITLVVTFLLAAIGYALY